MRAWIPLLLLLLSAPAGAAVQITLPLEGYYRPGRYMPLRISADLPNPGPGAVLAIQPSGAIETQVALTEGRAEGVIPLLPLSQIRLARWQLQRSPRNDGGIIEGAWRALRPEQRLVGFTTIDMPLARQLFPDAPIVPIRLDGNDPLPGPAAAWECLDAVVLDAAAPLDVRTAGDLLANGTAIAVRTDQKPEGPWPWRQMGSYWVATHASLGPKVTVEDLAPFAAVQGWRADWPAAFRVRVFLYAAIFSIVVLAAALLRPRYTAAVIVLISALTVGLLAWWWHGRSVVLDRAGQICVIDNSIVQVDTWRYQASATRALATVRWNGIMRPMLEMSQQASMSRMTLLCRENGQPAGFEYLSLPGLKVGFVSRSLATQPPAPGPMPPPTSPLMLLAKTNYLTANSNITGHKATTPPQDFNRPGAEWWGTLFIKE